MRNGYLFCLAALLAPMAYAENEPIYVDKSSDDIQVYYAEVTDSKVADINAKDADADALKVDMNACALHETLKSGGERYDCTEQLTKLADVPFAKRVFVDTTTVNGVIVPQDFYCSLLSVKTVIRDSVMADVMAVGFYIDLQFVYVPVDQLKQVDVTKNAKGEDLRIYEFGVVHRCAATADAAKVKWYMEFKPNIIVKDSATDELYRNWDNAFSNYKMFEEISKIDRRVEVETGKKPVVVIKK